jgi:hypothetical protein
MRITGGAVAARKSSKGTLIDRVSAEACYGRPCLPNRERARIMPPKVSADAPTAGLLYPTQDLGRVAIARSHARVRWR